MHSRGYLIADRWLALTPEFRTGMMVHTVSTINKPVAAKGSRNVPGHKVKSKRTGNNQSWFPERWTAEDIRQAGEFISRQSGFATAQNGQIVWGVYRGVRVGVIKTNGRPGTIFPDATQQPK